jgi:hypothetical protein
MVETTDVSVPKPEFAEQLSRRLHDSLGVAFKVAVVDKGELGQLTGIGEVMKVRRLLDRRKH